MDEELKELEQNSTYTIDELRNVYNLEDYQIKLVLKGDYNPWDFEEEDLEEDDYFEEE